MPYCNVSKERSTEDSGIGTNIFYRRFGCGGTKILLIIGLAATHEAWGPQIKGLTGVCEPNDDEEAMPAETTGDCSDKMGEAADGIEVCCFDNRGMGRSSIPLKKSEYSTDIMARDALALLDHLGWKKAHVFGHSMGAMIACKLAAMAPERLLSLALLNATGGGYECFPKVDRKIISIVFRFLRARTPQERAAVDLEMHYTKEYLDECVGLSTRRKVLHQKYVEAISSSGMQCKKGFEGQVHACWNHKLTSKELDAIRSAGFLILVIHGRHDVIAQLYHARKLAEKLQPAARMVELHGGHLVSHERPEEVNAALMELIEATKTKILIEEWSNLPIAESVKCGWHVLRRPMIILNFITPNRESYLQTTYNFMEKLQLSFLYVLGIFIMGFNHMRNAFSILLKPVRVSVSD
ncbi:uncharacterized protein LOC110021820 [Phalaenopsis equestris]|uniref:uncharacterized protein LOC110021820 n=1 Tax=Phalaenopsis equestris TaxID=78828 RepID=UPI0009E488AF|nr:uncharacterized protein LOC110021820 [Phalaenopsis equestris]